MKKQMIIAAALSLGLFAGCTNQTAQTTAQSAENTAAETTVAEAKESTEAAKTDAPTEKKAIKVGATPAPHAEILEEAKAVLEGKGYDLQIVEFTDYVQPNNALDAGEIDANFFQHVPYLDQFNEEYGTKLVSAAEVHYEPFGIYAGKTKALADLKDGAQIAVPNDVTNEARALQLLQQEGLITLKEGVGLTATKNDILENPKNLDIIEVEAAQVPRSLQDVDVAVINGNYAIEAGFKVKDALAVEAADSEAATTFANVIAVKEGNENNEEIKALVEAVKSAEVKKFIETKYEGSVVPLF